MIWQYAVKLNANYYCFVFKFVTNFKMPMVDNLCLVFPLSVQVGMCVNGWANSELPVRL